MDELTDDAKKLVEDQCATVLERYKETLREVEIYKWAARVFFTLVLGGSIIGFFQLQDYLDDRIAKGRSTLDQLFYAKALSDGSQPREALPELLEFARAVSSTSPPQNIRTRGERNMFGNFAKAGPTIKSYFFSTMLDVLSAVPGTDPDDANFGAVEWEELVINTEFNAFIAKNQTDTRILNRLGVAKIKFSATIDEAYKSQRYFERQLQFATKNDDRASALFVLGNLSLLRGDIDAAVKRFLEANRHYPDWVKNTESYFSTSDYVLYLRFFPSEEEYRRRYGEAFRRMKLAVAAPSVTK